MRVVFAPDSFSSTLSSVAAAAAIGRGWRAVRADDLVAVPMSDGGEGLLEAVEASVAGAQRRGAEVADAAGYAVRASWLRLPDGTAIVESAQACGLHRLPAPQRNPRATTTYGVGQLLAAAAGDAARIVLGLGGSATSDGGAGMVTALGHRLLRSDGNGVKVGAEYLHGLERVEPGPPLGVPVLAIADVEAVLVGQAGAVAGFARQKGAAQEDLPDLESNLAHLADVVERELTGGPWRDLPGAGAAGGLGFAAAAFLGAELRPGAAFVADLVGLDAALAQADVVVTGEGRWDDWSSRGKVPGEVVRRARAAGCRVLAVVGEDAGGAAGLCDDVVVLGPRGLDDPGGAVAAAATRLAMQLGV